MRKFLPLITLIALSFTGCDSVDDDRIPNLAVSVNIGDSGLWNTYGVAGFGASRNFILTSNLRQPSGFPYSTQSATGFGGILLINGMDPFTTTTDVPLAYDLACPVECKPDVRVQIEGDLYEAVCPVCHSHYDVTMSGGSPISGPAAKQKFGLRRYQCLPTTLGGYIITN
ncbi:MAG: hypothetical protein K2J78_13375 [Muribaculaceae bacterium]|nr:hypothetical protein [Muribaculaceae bacterium]MDE6770709.1 hypothetical protein [Muribaculaceae bacterium]